MSWKPGKGYFGLMWHFATTHQKQNPYMRDQTQFQRRMSLIKTTDGPIHSLWVLKTRLTCNWFVLGLQCQFKGHDFERQFIAQRRKFTYTKVHEGRFKAEANGPKQNVYVTTCRRCGYYRGKSWQDVPVDPTRQ